VKKGQVWTMTRDKIEISREDKEEKNNRLKKILNYFYFKL
jgi:hypothetical protein